MNRLLTLVVRIAMHAFPASFRREHGQDMLELHRDRLAYARERSGFLGGLRYGVRVGFDLIWAGLRERWERRSVRAWRPGVAWESLLLDLKVALRSLFREPAFLVLATLPVALGIAASTSMFSVADGVFLKPLPYPDPDELVVIGTSWPGNSPLNISPPNFRDLQERARSYERTAGYMTGVVHRTTDDGPERGRAAKVTAGFFETLQVMPGMGRPFSPDEFDAVILSYSEWRDRWGADPDVVGKTIEMEVMARGSELRTYRVIGVMGPDFIAPEALRFESSGVQFWVLDDYSDPWLENIRAFSFGSAIGRLADGVTLEQAREEMELLGAALIEEHPDANTRRGENRVFGVTELHLATVGDVGPRLVLLLVACGSLLLIASVNVANLFIARGDRTQADIALRLALGSSRRRVVRQTFIESSIVALLAGGFGTGLTFLVVDWFVRFSPGDIPRLVEIEVGGRALAFALVATTMSVFVAGLYPAIKTLGQQPEEVLRRRARSFSGRLHVARSAMMVAELTLAVVLVVTASVATSSFIDATTQELGFDAEGLISMRVGAAAGASDEVTLSFFDQLLRSIDAQPGLSSATATMFGVEGAPPTAFNIRRVDEDEPESIPTHTVLPGFFELFQIPVEEGRPFAETDGPNAPGVAVVSQSLAREWYGGESALGKSFVLSDRDNQTLTIVGVVSDLSTFTGGSLGSVIYLPYNQQPWLNSMAVVARYDTDVGSASLLMRRALKDVDPTVAPENISTVESRLAGTVAEPRFYSQLLGGFSLVSLLIAAIGVHATLAYMVISRVREIGIRMALGSTQARVVRLVLKHGLTIVFVGLAVGGYLATLAIPLLESVVVGSPRFGPDDAAVLGIVLLAVSAGACTLPALRASRVQPMEVLRVE